MLSLSQAYRQTTATLTTLGAMPPADRPIGVIIQLRNVARSIVRAAERHPDAARWADKISAMRENMEKL